MSCADGPLLDMMAQAERVRARQEVPAMRRANDIGLIMVSINCVQGLAIANGEVVAMKQTARHIKESGPGTGEADVWE